MNWLKQQAANIAGTQEPIYGPSAVRPVGREAGSPAYTEPTRNDFKWVAPHYTAVETQTFYLFAKTGHITFVQVIYSNVAGLRVTCQFNTKIFYPESGKSHLWSSDPLYNHGFSKDHTGFHADGCSIELSEDGTSYHVKSSTNKQSLVDLKIARAAPGFQAGKNGTTTFGTDPAAPWGSMRHVFWPRCESTGNIMTKEGPISFDGGQAVFIHALQGMKPHHAAARWNFVNFQAPTFSAVMMEFTTPASYGSTTVNVGAVVQNGQIIYAGPTNTAAHTKSAKDSSNDWPEPEMVDYKWTGKASDGRNLVAELAGALGPRLDRVDVMAEVPGFIKTFVGHAVGTKPYIYQYAPRQHLKLKLDIEGETHEEEGTLFAEATFISA